jgi:hypothetical protein
MGDEEYSPHGQVFFDKYRDAVNELGHGCLEIRFRARPFRENTREILESISQELKVRISDSDEARKVLNGRELQVAFSWRKKYTARTYYDYTFEKGDKVTLKGGIEKWEIVCRNAGPFTFNPQYVIQNESKKRTIIQSKIERKSQ